LRSGHVTELQASVAKAHFFAVLEEVERPDDVIPRHGKPVARRRTRRRERRKRKRKRKRKRLENIDRFGQEIRVRNGPLAIAVIISSIHEGHRCCRWSSMRPRSSPG